MKNKSFYLKVCTSGKICLSASKSRKKTIHIMTKTYEGQSICNANNLIIQSTDHRPSTMLCYAENIGTLFALSNVVKHNSITLILI